MPSVSISTGVEQMIVARMASGRYASHDELLHEALLILADEDQRVAALQEAIAEADSGNPGTPLEVVFERLKRKYDVTTAT